MATLKGVNATKLDNTLDNIYSSFKDLKEVLRDEILENKGNLSYDRVEEYEELFSKIKKCTVITDSMGKRENSIDLEGQELETFCSKLKMSKENYYKYQTIINLIGKFDLNQYISGVRESINFDKDLSKSNKENIERIQELEQLAYLDKLTGLYNRTKYEEALSKYKFSKNFGVIFCDLNGLKKANDNLGHEMGDLLIKTFSDILKTSKTGKEDVFRIGGDEFIAIFENAKRKDLTIFENALKYNIDQHNSNNDFEVSTSYGIAYSKEEPNLSMQELIKLADDRMYAMKKEMKAERVD